MSPFAIFEWVKTIKSKSGRVHFRRFAIFQTPWLSLYIHRIYEADHDPHLHSHPWPFWTMILSGSYWERTDWGLAHRDFLNSKSGGYDYFHKIESIISGPVTSIMIVGRRRDDWYYKVDGQLVRFDQYRSSKNEAKEQGS
jgi:hypothetical protein